MDVRTAATGELLVSCRTPADEEKLHFVSAYCLCEIVQCRVQCLPSCVHYSMNLCHLFELSEVMSHWQCNTELMLFEKVFRALQCAIVCALVRVISVQVLTQTCTGLLRLPSNSVEPSLCLPIDSNFCLDMQFLEGNPRAWCCRGCPS